MSYMPCHVRRPLFQYRDINPINSSISKETNDIIKDIEMTSEWYNELKILGLVKHFDYVLHSDFEDHHKKVHKSCIEKHVDESVYFCDDVTYIVFGSKLSNMVSSLDYHYYGNVIIIPPEFSPINFIKLCVQKQLLHCPIS